MEMIEIERVTGTFGTSAAINLVDMGFNIGNIKKSNIVRIKIDAKNARYTYTDGYAPTTSTGHSILAGDEIIVTGMMAIRQLQLISETGNCSFDITIGRI